MTVSVQKPFVIHRAVEIGCGAFTTLPYQSSKRGVVVDAEDTACDPPTQKSYYEHTSLCGVDTYPLRVVVLYCA